MADNITTWADSIGVWHVRVPRDLNVTERVTLASVALGNEIRPREPHADPSVWLYPTRVPELDTDDMRVYRESLPRDGMPMDEPAYPHTPRRAVFAALLVLLAGLTILGALRGAQSVPDGTPIPACAANGSGPAVRPCNWHESP